MTKEISELELTDNYEFEILMEHGEDVFFGRLNLTPSKITLFISADITRERQLPSMYGNLIELKCKTIHNQFILKELRFEKDSWRLLQPGISHVEKTYSVGYLVSLPNSFASNEHEVKAIIMQSEDISRWIGFTEKQQAILDNQNNPSFIFNQTNAIEFIQEITNVGTLSANYNVKQHNDTSAYQSGMSYPPNVNLQTTIPRTIEQTKKNIDTLYHFFAFFIGYDFTFQKITVHFNSPHLKGYFYFPSTATKARAHHDHIFFGLGRHPFPHLPEFPTQAFDNYFQLESKIQNYWSKYLKYRRMDSWEERFLGFFRLLESLCRVTESFLTDEQLESTKEIVKEHLKTEYAISFKKSKDFVGKIKAANGLKFNVSKCLTKYYSTLPTELKSKIEYDSSEFDNICELRNDITHANDFYISEIDLIKKTLFVEYILVFAMCEKIGIDHNTLINIMFRHSSYPSIQKY